MVKLIGELAEHAQEILTDIHKDIDAAKAIAKATHDFEEKLYQIVYFESHIIFEYEEYEDLCKFVSIISKKVGKIKNTLVSVSLRPVVCT